MRNYDDFNEFFWSRKCLKYDIYAIGNTFSTTTKSGSPKIVTKTFKERRSYIRALTSFRRVFFFTFALFLATVGFAINMTLLCPDSAIMYGPDFDQASMSKSTGGPVSVTGVSLNPTSANLLVGESVQLSETVSPLQEEGMST